MPRLDPSDLPWLGDTFVSRLPDPSIPKVGEGGAYNPVAWGSGMIKNTAILTGHLAREVATRIGWPDAQLGELAGLGQVVLDLLEGKIDLDTAVAAALQAVNLLRATLAGVAADVTEAVAEVVAGVTTAIPIVGWLLQIALLVWRSVRTILDAKVTPGAEDTPVAWSHGRDEAAANAVLEVLRGDDWTRIWTPRTADWSAITLSYDPWGRRSGWRFGPGGVFAPTRLGWMPGIAQGSDFYEGPVWGVRQDGTLALPAKKCIVQDRGCPQPSAVAMPTTTHATLEPSALSLAGMAWVYMQRETGACCAVDLDALADAWDAWAREGEAFVQRSTGSGPRMKALRTMVRGVLGHHGDLYPGPGPVVDQIRSILRAREDQLMRQLGTLAVAYVPPTAPALRNPRIRTRYEAMQRELLRHPARYDVEIDLVPEGGFRAALVASRLQPEGIGLAAPDAAAISPRRRTLDGGPAPAPPKLPGLGRPHADAGAAVLAATMMFMLM